MKIKIFRTNVETHNCASLRGTMHLAMTLWLMPTLLSAQNGVIVSGPMMNAGTVTFNISWDKSAMPAVWSDTVWVFAEYDNEGTMRRIPLSSGATLTATSAPGVGKVMEETGSDKGVWVVGDARNAGSFSATVKLLTATPSAGVTCVYASNCPPVGQYTSDTDISFTGTSPYRIILKDNAGGTITRESGSQFSIPAGYTLQSYRDKTGMPGEMRCMSAATFTLIASAPIICAGSEGITFALPGTEKGRKYRLYRGATVVGTLDGTGNAGTFTGSPFTVVGNYMAMSVDDEIHCATAMSGSHDIQETPLPVATAAARTICSGQTAALSATLGAGTTTAMTYTWNIGGTSSTTTVNSKTSQTLNANTTYTVRLRNDNGCVGAVSAPATITVNALPAIARSGGNASQNVDQYSVITTITYTASNATGITLSGGSLPSGVTGTASGLVFTISGAPSVAGTFGYAVSAFHTNGCAGTASSGTFTVKAVATPPNAASAKVWNYGSQAWSDAIQIPDCNKSTFQGSSEIPHCRSYNDNGTVWYYYNWPYVNTNKNTMCPSPWHVPTRDDFKTLSENTTASVLISAWGLGGRVDNNNVERVGAASFYWSSTGESSGGSMAFYMVYSSTTPLGTAPILKGTGYQVRCVK
jgi:hypothetical protein